MKAVIFDFNGTLFLDNDKHIKAWSEISMKMRGKPITEKELHENMNGCPNAMIIRFLNGGKEDPELEARCSLEKEALYRKFCKEDTERFHLIEGAEQLFDDLKAQGVPFTIASASIKPNIDFFVENFHLDRWMDPDHIVYDDGSYKNKEAMFEKAASYLQTPLKDITVIEDSHAGVNAALADGIEDIRIINSGNIKSEVENIPQVQQIVDSMAEITR